jgi:hypothetical protein
MSQQLQELIHRSSHVAFESGANAERYRIIKLVTDSKVINADQKYFLLQAIKGEQKEA